MPRSVAPPIEHLVVLMMENRSFDHYLGALSLSGRADVEGLPAQPRGIPDLDGNLIAPWCMDDAAIPAVDPPHGYAAAHASWNNGNNDGFVREFQKANRSADPRLPMGYYTAKTLPVYYRLAERFTICDHWYGSLLSSTWPNRKYLLSGQRDDDNDTQTVPPPPGFRTRPILDAIEDARDERGDRLTWRCYFSDLPFLGFWYPFAFDHLSNFTHVANFAADCQEDRLPTVSFIDPPFTLADDHPTHDPRMGQKFVGLVVDALTHSESWAKTALLILYDENGGFYDHAAPPAGVGAPPAPLLDQPLGFRVPAIVVSPYAKQGYACKTAFDHTAVMKSISTRWEVPFGDEYGPRWQLSPDIWSSCFDFGADPLPPGPYTPDAFHDLHWGTGIHDRLGNLTEGFERLLERVFVLPELKALDGRASLYDTLADLEQRVITRKRLYVASQ